MAIRSGSGLLAPVIWLYCGLKANEDVPEPA
jgi:hypothetical protein